MSFTLAVRYREGAVVVNNLKRYGIGVTGMFQHWAELRDATVYRVGWSILCVFALLVTLSIGLAAPTWADCDPGYGTCPGASGCYPLDDVCCPNGEVGKPGSVCCDDGPYPAGSQCCQGGGSCGEGDNCYKREDGGKPDYCIPKNADDYCGHNHYCGQGMGKCVYDASGMPSGCRGSGGSGGQPNPPPGGFKMPGPRDCDYRNNPNGCSTITPEGQ